ncbi:peptidoglycan-binding protein [Aliiroseovarius sp. F20344]|uniref:peptidoglycan-binding protein n=1 Tax=Aliiroseovarius sp. F20344 TaxID=2926414 RepID=UPI001FF69090|nr:peptidoglycan-binding protein [Aliiroseovarius sp. F20344]MCK0141593.1 peptidoglycan-binding protein [Aliiroseovarius sp. F20344]
MNIRKTIVIAALLGAATQASARDAALIVSQEDYRYYDDVSGVEGSDMLVDRLDQAGFDLQLSESERAENTWDSIAEFREDAQDAERILIMLAGRFATDGEETWLITRYGDVPSDLSIGATAVPLSAILNTASDFPESALVLLAPQGEGTELGHGLTPGIGEIDAPEGVTVLVGPANRLARYVDRVALAEGARMASRLRARYPAVTPYGHLSDFSPFTKPEVSKAERAERELNLTRNDRRNVQRDLALLGFDPGSIDGIFGRGTRAAITDWQRDAGKKESGFLNLRQIRLLGSMADKRAAILEEEARKRQEALEKEDRDYWDQTGKNGDVRGLFAYLKRYPDGLYAEQAQTKLDEWEQSSESSLGEKERQAWNKAKQANSIKSYQAYLKGYPKGDFAELASKRVAELKQKQARKAALAVEKKVVKNSQMRLFVETRLAKLGINPGIADGTFDAKTRKAIRQFQKSRGLQATGFVDKATLVRLLIGTR